MITIGSARKGETGYTHQKVGDQSTKEISLQEIYTHKYGWYILRPKNKTHAQLIAQSMINACNNNNIGYDQTTRNSLYNLVCKLNYDVTKVTTKCNCDCSALVRVCVLFATKRFIPDFTTATELKVLKATNLFNVIDYTTPDIVQVGDILVSKKKGHTAVVTDIGKTTQTHTVTYYTSCDKNVTSIIDGLKSIGVDSSLKFRKLLASENNVSTSDNYKMNIELLKLLKSGKLKKVG